MTHRVKSPVTDQVRARALSQRRNQASHQVLVQVTARRKHPLVCPATSQLQRHSFPQVYQVLNSQPLGQHKLQQNTRLKHRPYNLPHVQVFSQLDCQQVDQQGLLQECQRLVQRRFQRYVQRKDRRLSQPYDLVSYQQDYQHGYQRILLRNRLLLSQRPPLPCTPQQDQLQVLLPRPKQGHLHYLLQNLQLRNHLQTLHSYHPTFPVSNHLEPRLVSRLQNRHGCHRIIHRSILRHILPFHHRRVPVRIRRIHRLHHHQ